MGTALAAAAAKRPNILFLYTDDQGGWAFHRAGARQAVTPQLDRLCREGVWFENSFVSTPVCSPSRASLYTSRYGSEVGITDYLEFTRPDQQLGLSAKFETWPQLLQSAGYVTGLIGKWHLGIRPEDHPTHHGFGYFAGFMTGATGPADPPIEIDGTVRQFHGFTPDILTGLAAQFIERQKSAPFLLCVNYREPHASNAPGPGSGHRTWLPVSSEDWKPFGGIDIEIPNPDYPKLDVPEVTRMMREYLASVASVDRNVGRLLALLKQRDIERDTIVVFSSDNGMNMGHHGIWHKGNGKWILTDNKGDRPNLYDNALRVPAILRCPGRFPQGAVVKESITNLDWFPTILAMAGVEKPENVLVRGRNILPLIDRKRAGWNNDVYAEYGEYHGARAELRMWRTPDWKLIRDFHNSGKDELYDLRHDPAEVHNLIHAGDARVRDVRNRLQSLIVREMERLNDPLAKTATKQK